MLIPIYEWRWSQSIQRVQTKTNQNKIKASLKHLHEKTYLRRKTIRNRIVWFWRWLRPGALPSIVKKNYRFEENTVDVKRRQKNIKEGLLWKLAYFERTHTIELLIRRKYWE